MPGILGAWEALGSNSAGGTAALFGPRAQPSTVRAPRRQVTISVAILAFGFAVAGAVAQFRGGGGGGGPWRRPPTGDGPIDRGNVPVWPIDKDFTGDVFTFARIRYRSSWERQSLAWYTDYPDADLNLSFRLQQFTSLKVNPNPRLLEFTDPELFDYPWVFMSGVGNMVIDDEEAAALRKYLLNGGFLMVDDFWGEREWESFYTAIKRVFPDREPEDVPRNHQIFHCLFDIPDTRPLQTPNIRFAIANKNTGVTWEQPDAKEVHFRAIYDDKRRMMAFICHNTDNGDGWEEEGTDPWFFHTFSENKNYPLAFNIVYYAMTH